MNRIVVAGYPEEPHNSLIPSFFKCLDRPVFGEDLVRVLLGLDVVKLPAIEMVGLQPFETRLEQTHRAVIAAIMRLGCQVHFICGGVSSRGRYSVRFLPPTIG